MAYFAPSGTDAVELAVQLALFIQAERGLGSRRAVLGMGGSYHGMSIAATSLAGHASHRARLSSVLIDWPKLPPLSAPMEVWESAEVEQLFANAAAIVLEPVGGTTTGAVQPDPALLPLIRTIAALHGCIVIADEVITGFGRTGTSFVTAPSDADILVSGKWLGAGYAAICAVVVSGMIHAELREASRETPLRFTFANLSLSCAVADVVQQFIADHSLVARSIRVADRLTGALGEQLRTSPRNPEVRSAGLLTAIAFRSSNPEDDLVRMREVARRRHILAMFGSRVDGEGATNIHVMCTPALDATDADIDLMSQSVVGLVDA